MESCAEKLKFSDDSANLQIAVTLVIVICMFETFLDVHNIDISSNITCTKITQALL